MMTREMMMDALVALGADASWYEYDGVFRVELQDFDGFDDDWDEVDRDYDDPEAVEAFLDMLDASCLSREGDYYVTYHFDGFDVHLGYASYDI